MQKNKRVILAFIVLCIFVVCAASVYVLTRQDPVAGVKSISVKMVPLLGEGRTVEIITDAGYLRQALEENGLIEGDEGQYGLFVKTVDGITADDGNKEWWRFTKGGAEIMTGVDDTPIADGEHYEITLIAGY